MYNLVTTSIEETWDRSMGNLFLGDWCKEFDQSEVLGELNGSKFQKNNKTNENIIESQKYTHVIKEELLLELTTFLNSYHQTDFESRHWNIILGHWLTRFVDTLYNRYSSIEEVLKEKNALKTIVFDEDGFEFHSNDTAHFTSLCKINIWNHYVYNDILKYFNFEQFVYINKSSNISNIDSNYIRVNNIKTKVKKALNFLSFIFSRNADFFISTTYLPYKYEFLLQLKLKQVPGYWHSPDLKFSSKIDIKTRNISLPTFSKEFFRIFLYERVLKFLPKIFLEDFRQNWLLMNTLGWPKRPKIIFIANHFDTNEIYKFYIVKNLKENKTQYLVGQHGAHYGTTHQYLNYPEYVTSDYFFTWGWAYSKKDLIAFNFKIAAHFNSYKFNGQSDILLVQLPILHRNVVWDSFEYHNHYQNDQFELLKNLSSDLFNSVLVRLHHEHISSPWKEKQRFLAQFDNIKFSKSNSSILDLYLCSKLVIHSYDSTGILECLSMNVPMVAFWTKDVYQLNDFAIEDYQLLKDIGIFYDCPIKIAAFINSVGDISNWWNRNEVQEARLKFCDKYSKIEKKPILKIESQLTKILANHGN